MEALRRIGDGLVVAAFTVGGTLLPIGIIIFSILALAAAVAIYALLRVVRKRELAEDLFYAIYRYTIFGAEVEE